MKKDHFSIVTTDRISLQGKIHRVDEPSAVVLLSHGLGEHQDRYFHVAKILNDAGISFVTYDIRGHGISEGKRGFIPSYEQLLDDHDRVVDYVLKICGKVFLVLYGHSMGGNIVANYILRRKRPEVNAAVLSCPWLKLRMKVQFLELLAGKIMYVVRPGIIRNSNLNPHFFSHDQEVVKQYLADPKVHANVTPGLFFGHRKAGMWALKNAGKCEIPVLVMQSGSDEVVSASASRQFAEKAGATFKLWEDMYHEPHNELGKEDVLDFVVSWIGQQLKSF